MACLLALSHYIMAGEAVLLEIPPCSCEATSTLMRLAKACGFIKSGHQVLPDDFRDLVCHVYGFYIMLLQPPKLCICKVESASRDWQAEEWINSRNEHDHRCRHEKSITEMFARCGAGEHGMSFRKTFEFFLTRNRFEGRKLCWTEWPSPTDATNITLHQQGKRRFVKLLFFVYLATVGGCKLGNVLPQLVIYLKLQTFVQAMPSVAI